MRRLASLQAAVTMFALVALSSPLMVVAQEVTPPPAEEQTTEVQLSEEELSDDESAEEEAEDVEKEEVEKTGDLVSEILGVFSIQKKNDDKKDKNKKEGDPKFYVTKVVNGGPASAEDFSFEVTEWELEDEGEDDEGWEVKDTFGPIFFDEDGTVLFDEVDDDGEDDKKYSVTEVNPGPEYEVTYSADCKDVVFSEGDDDSDYENNSHNNGDDDDTGQVKTCTITNTYVGETAPETGSIEIMKYECPANTAVTRSENGVDGVVPEGCVPQEGASFGYVYGAQTDANGPYPELSESPTLAGVTDVNGMLVIDELDANGRYLVVETDGIGNKLPAEDVLGLYCEGDGDTSNTNDNQELTFVPENGTASCVAYNPAPETPPTTATVYASKIICPTEDLLPNWGDGLDDGSDEVSIDAFTVSEFLAANEECTLDPTWQFEWVTDAEENTNPGDESGVVGSSWSLFGLFEEDIIQAEVPAGGKVWVREVFKNTFIPFTGENSTEDVSAEMYCGTDVLNYDNWDYIDPVEAGEEYFCVAFNAPIETPEICEAGEKWADAVVEGGVQGDRKDGSNVLAARSDAEEALGANDSVFYSLGFGGSIVLSFSEYLEENAGDDLFIYETTNGAYPLETASVEVSKDGVTWFMLTEQAGNTAGGVTGIDVSETGLDWFRYVKITDTTNSAIHQNDADGFDLNAVKGKYGVCNEPLPPAPTKATVSATKVMCESEAYLPNMAGGADITSTTAANFLATGDNAEHCWLEDGYEFQWAPNGTQDPADNGTDALGSPWTSFAPTNASGVATAQVTVADVLGVIQVREVLKTGDQQFTGDNNNVSAELFCASDVAGYDNWEWISNPSAGQTYHCVAFNANPDAENPNTPTDAKVSVHIAKYVDGEHATAENTNGASFPMLTTFNSTVHGNAVDAPFTLDQNGWYGDPAYEASFTNSNAGSDYATHEVTGTNVGETCQDEKPFALLGYKVGTSFADAADNELSETAPAFTNLQSDKYVIVWNETCENGGGGGNDEGTIVIVKNAIGGNETFDFDIATGLQATVTVPDATITTVGGVGTSTNIVPAGTYTVTEYPEAGWTLQGASCVETINGITPATAVPSTQFVVQDGDEWTCTFTNTKDGEQTATSHTTVVRLGDLADDVTELISNSFTQWVMYNDSTDAIDSTLGSFVSGPATAPAGEGSVEFTLAANPNDRKNIATYEYAGTQLSDITRLEFSAYSHSGVSGPTESPYLVFNVDFTGTNSFQSRLVYVPANNGAVPQDAWNTFDTIDGGTGQWVYSGATWPAPNAQPGTTPKSWAQIMTDYPNASILSPDGHLGVRVGEPGPDGYVGNVDQFVIGVVNGSNTHTETYDFEPEAPVTPADSNDNDSDRRSSSGRSNNDEGEVAGVTDEQCGPLLSEYLGKSYANTASEVTKLQEFLNGEVGSALPLTGFFGPMTESAVRTFQLKYWEDVLQPWFAFPQFGVLDADDSTGIVYKTTKWKINDIFCKDSEAMPVLP